MDPKLIETLKEFSEKMKNLSSESYYKLVIGAAKNLDLDEEELEALKENLDKKPN